LSRDWIIFLVKFRKKKEKTASFFFMELELQNNLLESAVERGDVDAVRDLLRAGADANREMQSHRPLFVLFRAALKNHVSIALELIRHGARVNEVNKHYDNAAPLHVAAEQGDALMCQTLLRHGAVPHVCDALNRTALNRAVLSRRCKIVSFLLAWYKSNESFCCSSSSSSSPPLDCRNMRCAARRLAALDCDPFRASIQCGAIEVAAQFWLYNWPYFADNDNDDDSDDSDDDDEHSLTGARFAEQWLGNGGVAALRVLCVRKLRKQSTVNVEAMLTSVAVSRRQLVRMIRPFNAADLSCAAELELIDAAVDALVADRPFDPSECAAPAPPVVPRSLATSPSPVTEFGLAPAPPPTSSSPSASAAVLLSRSVPSSGFLMRAKTATSTMRQKHASVQPHFAAEGLERRRRDTLSVSEPLRLLRGNTSAAASSTALARGVSEFACLWHGGGASASLIDAIADASVGADDAWHQFIEPSSGALKSEEELLAAIAARGRSNAERLLAAADSHGRSLFHFARTRRLAQALVDACGRSRSLDELERRRSVGRGDAPLHSLCAAGCFDAVVYLVEELGFKTTTLVNAHRKTPLYYACAFASSGGKGERTLQAHQRFAVKLLAMRSGASLNLANTSDGMTPLHVATLGERTDLCAILLEAGADATIEDAQGRHSLLMAVQSRCTAAVELLAAHAPHLIHRRCAFADSALAPQSPYELLRGAGQQHQQHQQKQWRMSVASAPVVAGEQSAASSAKVLPNSRDRALRQLLDGALRAALLERLAELARHIARLDESTVDLSAVANEVAADLANAFRFELCDASTHRGPRLWRERIDELMSALGANCAPLAEHVRRGLFERVTPDIVQSYGTDVSRRDASLFVMMQAVRSFSPARLGVARERDRQLWFAPASDGGGTCRYQPAVDVLERHIGGGELRDPDCVARGFALWNEELHRAMLMHCDNGEIDVDLQLILRVYTLALVQPRKLASLLTLLKDFALAEHSVFLVDNVVAALPIIYRHERDLAVEFADGLERNTKSAGALSLAIEIVDTLCSPPPSPFSLELASLVPRQEFAQLALWLRDTWHIDMHIDGDQQSEAVLGGTIVRVTVDTDQFALKPHICREIVTSCAF
jgi:ankyrin repeat protein